MNSKEFAKQLEGLAALDEPVRRKLYLYVVGRGGDVSRDEAARSTRVSRALAAFHLDKLVEADLLQATFRRLSGRKGPGAGRPSKLYRRSSAQFDVSLPQRRYELAAHVLAHALAKAGAGATLEALRNAARECGKRLAEESAAGTGRGGPLSRAARALKALGFEPQGTTGGEGEVVLRNCPFDSLRTESRDLICPMNLALIEGLLAGLGVKGVRARLAPHAGTCCVALKGSRR
ncbi:MAG: transcriptional regulator [Candidatus Eisenbacteria bacterium]|uniref:Transcriptional regulator n=1 Tax=Eiseniibacteriota bacterium TaxID=2212470 RepID=A0A538T8U8_UNCEI|nr:MAG: transcriptional regulator [Candidatus Eisenbacteria bacterium]